MAPPMCCLHSVTPTAGGEVDTHGLRPVVDKYGHHDGHSIKAVITAVITVGSAVITAVTVITVITV